MSFGPVAGFQKSPSLDAQMNAALGIEGASFARVHSGRLEVVGQTVQLRIEAVDQTPPARAALKKIFDAATLQLVLDAGHGDDWLTGKKVPADG